MAQSRAVKRFYKDVATAPAKDGYRVTLDGRGVNTPMGVPQIVPTRALADALAKEWADQAEVIDPALFRHRDHADYAIDILRAQPQEPVAKLLGFLETDTLCYRADPGDALFVRQDEVWEPLVSRFEACENVRLERISGIVHRPQPPRTLEHMRRRLESIAPFELASVFALASRAASLVIGMAALEPDADVDALWNAVNLEEDWQAEHWGQDAEAAWVRETRRRAFRDAHGFYRLVTSLAD